MTTRSRFERFEDDVFLKVRDALRREWYPEPADALLYQIPIVDALALMQLVSSPAFLRIESEFDADGNRTGYIVAMRDRTFRSVGLGDVIESAFHLAAVEQTNGSP